MGIVLLGVFIVYIFITFVVLIVVVKLVPKGKWKWISAFLVILISILIPTWDIPIGRINYNNLCEKEAGQFIYKRVDLGNEYFLSKGERDLRYQENSPNAFAKGGELNIEKIKKDYEIKNNLDREYSRWGNIYKNETVILTRYNSFVLSRAVSFYYGGGWLVNYFSNSAIGGSNVCPEGARLKNNRPFTIHSDLPDVTFIKISKNGV